jgi:hypothetical protein
MADLAMELGISAKSIWEWVWLSEESGDSTSEDEKIDLSFGWWRSTCEW